MARISRFSHTCSAALEQTIHEHPKAVLAPALEISRYSVLVADGFPIVREGLVGVINRQADMRVIAEVSNATDAVAAFFAQQPDIGIIDLCTPEMDGIDIVSSICDRYPRARLVVFTTSQTEEDIFHAMRAGAQGYVLKNTGIDDIVRCLRAVAEGKTWIPSAVAAKLAKRVSDRELTRRETEVLRAIAVGRSNKEIGSMLGISEGTVKVHVTHILEKLKAGGRTEAINFAVQRGLLHLDAPRAA